MAIVYCNTHGRTDGGNLCEHIVALVSARSRVPKPIVASFSFGFFGGDPSCPLVQKLGYCDKCVIDYGFPSISTEMPDEDFERVVAAGFKLVCVKCLDELVEA